MTRRQSGRRDQAVRNQLAPLVDSGRAVCWRCNQPILPGQPWDAGHLEDIALGGHPAGRRLPEHRLKADCPAGGNRSNGAQLGRQLAARRRVRPRFFLDAPN